MIDLKPCPFCGGEAGFNSRPSDLEGFRAFVFCFCGGYSACAHKAAYAETKEEATRLAAEAWNKRAEVPNE